MRRWLILPTTWLLLAVAPVQSAERSGDDQVLADARIATDAPSLIAFFHKRSLDEAGVARVEAAVRRLGDASYPVREEASRELMLLGRAAIPFLQRAVNDPDLEIGHRAQLCLQSIEASPDAAIVLAAARTLAVRKPEAAPAALLRYLPFAEEIVEEELLTMLASVGVREGQVAPAVSQALSDRLPERRAAAAFVLAALRTDAVRAVLTDSSPRVRLRAAEGLTLARRKDGIPTLLALLEEAPMTQAWQAENLLFRLADERGPAVSLATGTAEERRLCRQAWSAWWKQQGDKLDLTRITLEERPLGLTLIVAYDGYNQGAGKVFEMGADGRVRWQIDNVRGPVDAQVLGGGRVLIAEYNAGRFSERTLDGKVVWERKGRGNPVNCRRLPSGNRFLATTSDICELTPDDKPIWEITGKQVYCAWKLRTGNVAYLSVDGSLIELDMRGKEVRRFSASSAPIGLLKFAVLPAGRYLVPQQTTGRVKEFDAAGKLMWDGPIPNARVAQRLPNGNTLICGHNGDPRVAEIDRAGRIVWEKRLEGHAHQASRR